MIPTPLKRPKFVWILFVLYWIGVPLTVVFMAVAALRLKNGGTPILAAVDIVVGILELTFRGIGIVRLFYLKKDAWLYLAFSSALLATNCTMDVIGAYMLKGTLAGALPVLLIVSSWIAITVYAYRITNPSSDHQS